MNYYDSAEGMRITLARALLECKRHGVDVSEFLTEMGEHASYDAQMVLSWLGY